MGHFTVVPSPSGSDHLLHRPHLYHGPSQRGEFSQKTKNANKHFYFENFNSSSFFVPPVHMPRGSAVRLRGVLSCRRRGWGRRRHRHRCGVLPPLVSSPPLRSPQLYDRFHDGRHLPKVGNGKKKKTPKTQTFFPSFFAFLFSTDSRS